MTPLVWCQYFSYITSTFRVIFNDQFIYLKLYITTYIENLLVAHILLHAFSKLLKISLSRIISPDLLLTNDCSHHIPTNTCSLFKVFNYCFVLFFYVRNFAMSMFVFFFLVYSSILKSILMWSLIFLLPLLVFANQRRINHIT